MKKALDALQDWVNCNRGAAQLPMKKGIIHSEDVVKVIGKRINSSRTKLKDDLNIDIQAGLLGTVSPEHNLLFVLQCYRPGSDKTRKMNLLTLVQVAVGFTLSACTMQRSEHVRALKYKFLTTLEFAQLGPLGTECDILVANSGKPNKNDGHIEARALPPNN
jgi:hypothetical protein